jgi:hypothetical protein
VQNAERLRTEVGDIAYDETQVVHEKMITIRIRSDMIPVADMASDG